MIGMTEGGADFGGILGHAKFQLPSRHPSGDVKWAVRYISLEFRGKILLEIIEFAV